MTAKRTPKTTHCRDFDVERLVILKRKCRPKLGGTSFLHWRLFEPARAGWACFALFSEPRGVICGRHDEEGAAHEGVRIAAKLRAVDHVFAFFLGVFVERPPARNAQAGLGILRDAERKNFEGMN